MNMSAAVAFLQWSYVLLTFISMYFHFVFTFEELYTYIWIRAFLPIIFHGDSDTNRFSYSYIIIIVTFCHRNCDPTQNIETKKNNALKFDSHQMFDLFFYAMKFIHQFYSLFFLVIGEYNNLISFWVQFTTRWCDGWLTLNICPNCVSYLNFTLKSINYASSTVYFFFSLSFSSKNCIFNSGCVKFTQREKLALLFLSLSRTQHLF